MGLASMAAKAASKVGNKVKNGVKNKYDAFFCNILYIKLRKPMI